MICYRDMTFCQDYIDCECHRVGECTRALTSEVQLQADGWWGKEGAPIAVYAHKPECHRPVQGD